MAFEKARAVNIQSQAPLPTSEPESVSELDPRVIDSLASKNFTWFPGVCKFGTPRGQPGLQPGLFFLWGNQTPQIVQLVVSIAR